MVGFYEEMQLLAHELIEEFGMGASLRRDGADRPCIACIYDHAPNGNDSSMVQTVERRILISAITPEVQALPPDCELDTLITYKQPMTDPPIQDRELRFNKPVRLYSPAGLVVAFDLSLRK